MKCPWRPVQVTEQFDEKRREIVRIDFEDCYKGECPFYSPACKISANLSTCEHCKRTSQEVQK